MTATSLDKKSFWVLALSLAVTALLIYWPSPRMGYVLDDHYVIARNPAVKNPSLPRILTSGLFDAAGRKTDSKLNYYRPLLTASFAADQYFFGSDPFAQRLVNLLIHVLNCVLVFGLFYLLFGNARRAGLAAILFCILPVHEWSVRYIVGRGDLLSTFFGLLTLISVVLFMRKNLDRWFWAGAGFFACALLCKESAILISLYVLAVAFFARSYLINSQMPVIARNEVTKQSQYRSDEIASLPAVARNDDKLSIYEMGSKKDIKRILFVGAYFAIISGLYYGLRLQLLPISANAAFDLIDFSNGLILGIIYIFRFWMPAFGHAAIAYAPVITLVWVVSCIGLLVSIIKRSEAASRRGSACVLGVLWMGAGIAQYLVVQRVIGRLGPVLSEHFLYFQAVGFVLVLAVMIEGISRPLLRKAVFAGFVLFYVSLSLLSGRYWTSEEELLRHVQKLEGRPYTVAHEQLVMRFDHDENSVLEFITRAPSGSSKSVWYRRLGDVYHKRRDYPRAMDALSRAVTLNQKNTEALNQWAVCYFETGASREGLDLLLRSITVDPQQSDAYRLAGIFFYHSGRYLDAIANFNMALANDPDQHESALHLMMAYYFVNDQNAYLQVIDRLRSVDQRVLLSFAAREFYNHGFFQEAAQVIGQSARLFENDPAMTVLAEAARQKSGNLPK